MTGEDLGSRPSVLEKTKFGYSLLVKFLIRDWRLKNIEKNQNVNNSDKNKKTNDESKLSSVKSESSGKTSN